MHSRAIISAGAIHASAINSVGDTIAVSAWSTPLGHHHLRLPDRRDRLSARAPRLACSLRRCRQPTAGAATSSALALAIQVLIWGRSDPFAGAIADRFGRCACCRSARCSIAPDSC